MSRNELKADLSAWCVIWVEIGHERTLSSWSEIVKRWSFGNRLPFSQTRRRTSLKIYVVAASAAMPA